MGMKKGWLICLILGALLLAAALGLFLFNQWDSARAGKEAEEVLDLLSERITETVNRRKAEGQAGTPSAVDPAAEEQIHEDQAEMPTVAIGEYEYIGVIEIPDIRIHLPVMSECDLTRLKTAPCRYSGSYYDNDLVIAAHNYGEHFSRIKSCRLGIDVYFTTVDGLVYHYIVANRENVNPFQINQMITADGWDLTLFTCNSAGNTRCALRCILADDI